MIGDCATYYDEPTLIGPIDGLVPTSTFFGGTVTMTNAALTATYGPGGLLAEGVHSLVRPLNSDLERSCYVFWWRFNSDVDLGYHHYLITYYISCSVSSAN
jgi:hypothetical protein